MMHDFLGTYKPIHSRLYMLDLKRKLIYLGILCFECLHEACSLTQIGLKASENN